MTQRVFVSPNARRLARELGVHVENLKGTGPNGRIISRDVQAATQPKPVTVRRVRVRATACARKLMKLRDRLNRDERVPITLDDLVIRAAARAHRLALETDAPVDLAVAVPNGREPAISLLKAVDAKPLSAVAAALRQPGSRDGTESGALTVMSLTGQGVEDFDITLEPPQPMVLTVGVHDGLLRATLSVDPRVIDITTAATWMRTFASLIENPVRILI